MEMAFAVHFACKLFMCRQHWLQIVPFVGEKQTPGSTCGGAWLLVQVMTLGLSLSSQLCSQIY